jgi:FkbM family methyltransferase
MALFAKRMQQLRKLVRILAHRSYRDSLRRAGVAAATEHEPLLRTLNFATVVDIGANRGQFSLVARRCYPEARLIAFEPLAKPAEQFRTALGSDPFVTLHQVAVGPAKSSASMHVAAEDDSSSLLAFTDLQQSLSAGTVEVASETVQIERLTDRVRAEDLKSPALLKIDVQGYELAALEGCEPLLHKFSHIYAECSFVELYSGQPLAPEVIGFLWHAGFRLQGVYNVSYDRAGQAIQADMLFACNSSNSSQVGVPSSINSSAGAGIAK